MEEGRLTVYNGDLTRRIIAINADEWTKDELAEVIRTGEASLNMQFAAPFKEDLLNECSESVCILQEACYISCRAHGVCHTHEHNREICDGTNAKQVVKSVVDEQSGRYTSFVSQFASGFQETALQMYKWLLLPILTSDVDHLEEGWRLAEIRKLLQANHPEGKNLNFGNITQALQSSASLQVNKDIKPIILDYDQTNLKLNVVDRGFLIWLENQGRNELLELADIPKLSEVQRPPSQPQLFVPNSKTGT